MRLQYVVLAALAVLFCPPDAAEASPDLYAGFGGPVACFGGCSSYCSLPEEDGCSNLTAILGLELHGNRAAFEVRGKRVDGDHYYSALYALRSGSDWLGRQSEGYIGATDDDLFVGVGRRVNVARVIFFSMRIEYLIDDGSILADIDVGFRF